MIMNQLRNYLVYIQGNPHKEYNFESSLNILREDFVCKSKLQFSLTCVYELYLFKEF